MSQRRPVIPLTVSLHEPARSERKLYIWFDRDPYSGPPDLAIDDVPGRADLDLLAEAIRDGRLGKLLPTRLVISPHELPRLSSAYRTVNVPNLLRQYRIPYRTRLELLIAEPAEPSSRDDESPTAPEPHQEG